MDWVIGPSNHRAIESNSEATRRRCGLRVKTLLTLESTEILSRVKSKSSEFFDFRVFHRAHGNLASFLPGRRPAQNIRREHERVQRAAGTSHMI